MQTIVETPSFLSAAKAAGMTEAEREVLKDLLARDPKIGEEIKETGGFRKLRFAKSGRGKSGGYRVFIFYSGKALPVFLITVFSKGEKDNLAKAERNELRALATTLKAYGRAGRAGADQERRKR